MKKLIDEFRRNFILLSAASLVWPRKDRNAS